MGTEARGDRFEHAMRRLELGFLRHKRDTQLRRAPHGAAIEILLAEDDFKKSGLAAAVTADQRDVLTGVQREIGMIEEGGIAKCKRCLVERNKGHRAKP